MSYLSNAPSTDGTVGDVAIDHFLGGVTSVTETSYADKYNRIIFDKSLYPNATAIYFKGLLQQVVGSGAIDVFSQLVLDDGTAITGGEITANLGVWGQSVVSTGDLLSALPAGETILRTKMKVSSGEGAIVNPVIEVIVPAGGTKGDTGATGATGQQGPAGSGGGQFNPVQISGMYFQTSFTGESLSESSLSIGKVSFMPFMMNRSVTIDQFGVEVTSASSGNTVNAAIYNSDSNGLPSTVLDSTGDQSATTTGFKYKSSVITLTAGVQYWLAVKASAAVLVKSQSAFAFQPIGKTSATDSTQRVRLDKTHTYTDPFPENVTFSTSELESGNAFLLTCRIQ